MCEFAQQLWLEAIKAGIGLISGLLLLGATWFVGQRIIALWDKRKKQQELDIATSTQFQQLIGEFKEISKLWAVAYARRHGNEYQKELLERATAAESKVEAILVKLATERQLCQGESGYLGLFRQGYQQLRESIRDDSPPRFEYKVCPEYHLFNELVCEVANIVSKGRPWERVPPQEVKQNLSGP